MSKKSKQPKTENLPPPPTEPTTAPVVSPVVTEAQSTDTAPARKRGPFGFWVVHDPATQGLGHK